MFLVLQSSFIKTHLVIGQMLSLLLSKKLSALSIVTLVGYGFHSNFLESKVFWFTVLALKTSLQDPVWITANLLYDKSMYAFLHLMQTGSSLKSVALIPTSKLYGKSLDIERANPAYGVLQSFSKRSQPITGQLILSKFSKKLVYPFPICLL